MSQPITITSVLLVRKLRTREGGCLTHCRPTCKGQGEHLNWSPSDPKPVLLQVPGSLSLSFVADELPSFDLFNDFFFLPPLLDYKLLTGKGCVAPGMMLGRRRIRSHIYRMELN